MRLMGLEQEPSLCNTCVVLALNWTLPFFLTPSKNICSQDSRDWPGASILSLHASGKKWEQKDRLLELWWSGFSFLSLSLRTAGFSQTADLGSAQACLTLLACLCCSRPPTQPIYLGRQMKRGFAAAYHVSYTQEPLIPSDEGSFKKWREGNTLASVPAQPCLSAV